MDIIGLLIHLKDLVPKYVIMVIIVFLLLTGICCVLGLTSFESRRKVVMLSCICDNPMASQLLNHLGGSAIKYCRICMVCICDIGYAHGVL